MRGGGRDSPHARAKREREARLLTGVVVCSWAVVAVLQCPKCGSDAPGERDGTERICKFCGVTMLFEKPAPVIRQQIIQQEVIRRVVLVDPASGTTSLPCPRCATALFEGKAGEVTLHGCGACGGVWLDNGTSRALIERVQRAVVQMADRAARAGTSGADQSGPARCPLDGATMQRVTVRGIDVDACATHGTWFDAGEVRRITEAYDNERLQMAAGPTHDYSADAQRAIDNQRYAQGAVAVLGAILSGLAKT